MQASANGSCGTFNDLFVQDFIDPVVAIGGGRNSTPLNRRPVLASAVQNRLLLPNHILSPAGRRRASPLTATGYAAGSNW